MQKVLQRFNIDGDTNFVSTPLAPHFKLKATMSSTTIDCLLYTSDAADEEDSVDLGEAKKVLVMEIERDRRSDKVSLTQKGCLQKVLQRFNIDKDTKSVSIPLAPHFKLKATMSPKTFEEREYMTRVHILAQLVV